MSKQEQLYSLAAEYLELKEVRDHYDGVMKTVSQSIKELMEDQDLARFKEDFISISMVDGSRVSVKTFKDKLIEVDVGADKIAAAETLAKPKPKHSPRISKLKNQSKQILTKGIGG